MTIITMMNTVGYLQDRRTLIFEQEVPVSPETAWKAVGTMEGLNSWFMHVSEEIIEGNRFSFKGGWEGDVGIVNPPHHIQFNADHPDSIPFDPVRSGYLQFRIEETNMGCKVMLIDTMNDQFDASTVFPDNPPHHKYQPGGLGTHHSGVIAGYHGFFRSLMNHLTGSEGQVDYDETCYMYMKMLDNFHSKK